MSIEMDGSFDADVLVEEEMEDLIYDILYPSTMELPLTEDETQ